MIKNLAKSNAKHVLVQLQLSDFLEDLSRLMGITCVGYLIVGYRTVQKAMQCKTCTRPFTVFRFFSGGSFQVNGNCSVFRFGFNVDQRTYMRPVDTIENSRRDDA